MEIKIGTAGSGKTTQTAREVLQFYKGTKNHDLRILALTYTRSASFKFWETVEKLYPQYAYEDARADTRHIRQSHRFENRYYLHTPMPKLVISTVHSFLTRCRKDVVKTYSLDRDPLEEAVQTIRGDADTLMREQIAASRDAKLISSATDGLLRARYSPSLTDRSLELFHQRFSDNTLLRDQILHRFYGNRVKLTDKPLQDYWEVLFRSWHDGIDIPELDWFIIDEAQDLSRVMWLILMTYVIPRAKRVTLLGDPTQAIYGFAGADPQFLLNHLTSMHPTTYLDNTFRMFPASIALFNSLIRKPLPTATSVKPREIVGRDAPLNPVSDRDYTVRFLDYADLVPDIETVPGDEGVSILCRTQKSVQMVQDRLFQSIIPYTTEGSSNGQFELISKINRRSFLIMKILTARHWVLGKYADEPWPQEPVNIDGHPQLEDPYLVPFFTSDELYTLTSGAPKDSIGAILIENGSFSDFITHRDGKAGMTLKALFKAFRVPAIISDYELAAFFLVHTKNRNWVYDAKEMYETEMDTRSEHLSPLDELRVQFLFAYMKKIYNQGYTEPRVEVSTIHAAKGREAAHVYIMVSRKEKFFGGEDYLVSANAVSRAFKSVTLVYDKKEEGAARDDWRFHPFNPDNFQYGLTGEEANILNANSRGTFTLKSSPEIPAEFRPSLDSFDLSPTEIEVGEMWANVQERYGKIGV
jgi:superfamily I DNA/RNA helicase